MQIMKSKEDVPSVKIGDWEEMIKLEGWWEYLYLKVESVNCWINALEMEVTWDEGVTTWTSFLNQSISVSVSGLVDVKEGVGDKNEIKEVKNGFISFYYLGEMYSKLKVWSVLR